nr:Sulfate/thiosulfate import ATP-binding protein cysA [Ipomoea batatas]
MIIPSCFSNPTSASSSPSSSSASQNLVTCIYQTRILGSPIHLTLTWSKILFSHSLTIHAADDDMFSITLPLQASTFSLFQSRSGSKTVQVGSREKMKIYWDFTRAKYAENSAEPESGFYVGHGVFVFQIGDVGVWPEMVSVEKKLIRKSLSLTTDTAVPPSSPLSLSPSSLSPSCSSVLQWAEESSDCGRSSCSSIVKIKMGLVANLISRSLSSFEASKGEDAETPVPQGMKEEAIPSETKNTIPTKDTGVLKNLIISSYDTKAPKDTAAPKQH